MELIQIDPAHLLEACADQYHVDHWQDQQHRAELWVEKDALLGVVEPICQRWDCPFFSCRGYPSVSELHEAAKRIKRYKKKGQDFKLLYCGDHDPSGLNMGDAITRTLKEFGADVTFERIALNIEQIRRFNPPPNPVKKSDRRAKGYRQLYGDDCWELDALPPEALNEIIETAIINCIDDMGVFERRRTEDLEGRERLRLVGDHFDEVCRHVEVLRYGDDDDE